MPLKLSFAVIPLLALSMPLVAQQENAAAETQASATSYADAVSEQQDTPSTATNVRLKDVFESPSTDAVLPQIEPVETDFDPEENSAFRDTTQWDDIDFLLSPEDTLLRDVDSVEFESGLADAQ